MAPVTNKKNMIIISIIAIIDIIITGSWVLYIRPEPSVTIVLIFAIPILFFANLIICGIVYFIQKRYVHFLVFNAFISPLILFCFFQLYVYFDLKKNNETWEFEIDKANYEISYRPHDVDNAYWLDVSRDKDSSQSYDRGIVKAQNDTIYFFSSVDSMQYYIYKNYLYNFKDTGKIRVKKTY